MRTRSTIISALLAFAIAFPLAGCGENDNNDNEGQAERTATPTPAGVRTATPTVTATPPPGETPTVTETPSQTETPAGPTVTPTPVAGACQSGDQLTVVASLDKAYGAALIELAYPASANIPGTASAQSVADRVVFAATGGITTANDEDKVGSDGVDDTLTASFVSFSDHAAGTFVTVTFDCVAGQAPPAAGDFDCTVVSASTGGGVPITDENCSLDVTGP